MSSGLKYDAAFFTLKEAAMYVKALKNHGFKAEIVTRVSLFPYEVQSDYPDIK